MEKWKDIPGYEGIYQASNVGKIRTCKNKTTFTIKHGERHWKQRVLKQKLDQYNCYRVTLWKDGKPRDYFVHRLTCATYHGNLLNTAMTVNHKDGNRKNNNADNLEWMTRSENIKHSFETNLASQKNIELVNIQTHEVFKFRSMSVASRELGRNTGYISLCRQRNSIPSSVTGIKYFIKDCFKEEL